MTKNSKRSKDIQQQRQKENEVLDASVQLSEYDLKRQAHLKEMERDILYILENLIS